MQIAGAPFGTTNGLRHLCTLDVTGNDRVTNKGIVALQKCEMLETLRCAWCKKIDDSSISQVSFPHVFKMQRLVFLA